MSLHAAIQMMGTTVTISMFSDNELATDVARKQVVHANASPGLPTKTKVIPAFGVDGPLKLRPISAMLELARGTSLNDSPDIAAFARRWSVLRYLGVFAKNDREELHLDGPAIQYIGPNQRRVLSEELGIGFGILVAKHWCRMRNPNIGSITAIDVDKALNSRAISTLRQEGNRQPDYLLAYPDPANPGSIVYGLAETKGTASKPNAKIQLGRAVTQLAGLTVGRRSMTGIAVSTVAIVEGISVLAVDPEEPPVTWRPTQDALDKLRHTPTQPREETPTLDVPADELFAGAIDVDNASLAAFCGREDAAKRWLPTLSDRKTGTEKVRRTTDAGTFVGTEFIVTIPGTNTRVRLYQGAEEHVVEGLEAFDAFAVFEAQREFGKEGRGKIEESAYTRSDSRVTSAAAISSDGSMMEISIE